MNVNYLITCLIVCCIRKSFVLASLLNDPTDLTENNVGGSGEPGAAKAVLSTDYKKDVPPRGNLRAALLNSSNLNATEYLDNSCLPLKDAGRLTQTQLINRLTAPCRYDRLERPHVSTGPVKIYIRVHIYVLQNLKSSDLQFKVNGLIQMRYNDSRLQYANYAPGRTEPLIRASSLGDLIWVPQIFLANEHNSNVGMLGSNEKDVVTAISPSGTVIISSSIQATLYCRMKLQKFPFDEQFCPMVFESWIYNSSELLLRWEENEPVAFDPKIHMTEYSLQNVWKNETIIKADLNDLRHGAFANNYSAISFTIHLTREVGYYIMDYFLPSIMIVAISWVTFWLQPDQTPARTTLGCTTLLSFITLSSSQDNNLPKVGYIKISEVWFLGCTCFIFSSLVEFAFVNTIWRRKHCVEVKKLKSKYIMKSTITPNMKRHKIMGNNSCDNHSTPGNECELYLTVVESPVIVAVDEVASNKFKSTESFNSQSFSVDEPKSEMEKKHSINSSWATMSPHEVSLWIDKKARFLFPLAFIIFNAFFWTFVYCL